MNNDAVVRDVPGAMVVHLQHTPTAQDRRIDMRRVWKREVAIPDEVIVSYMSQAEQ